MNTQTDIKLFNTAQSAWMNLKSSDSEKERKRVLELMDKIPKSYITGHSGKYNLLINSMPCFADSQNLETIRVFAVKHEIRVDISWDCKGTWIELPK